MLHTSYPQKTGKRYRDFNCCNGKGFSMGEKVVGYVRVSTEGQVREGYSLTYQVEEIERYCNENKLQLLHIYKDKGISGAIVEEDGLTVEREGLQELLSDMAYHKVSQVVVLNTSRLWSSDMAKVLIQRELKKHEVYVKAIEQPNYSIYTHDPNDFLVNGMLELLDQYRCLEIVLKLSRGRKKKAEQGYREVMVTGKVGQVMGNGILIKLKLQV